MNDFINFPSNIDKAVGATAPSASIIIAKGIEWDNSYIHVRDYGSTSALLAHVRSKAIYSTDSAVPAKEGKWVWRPQANSADIQKANYMAYKNSPYENEWHFAFITSVEWLSHNSCQVNYELDVFSECWYSCNKLPCFVERMHIAKADDKIGANIVPDNLETGDLVVYNTGGHDLGEPQIGIMFTELPRGFSGADVKPSVVQNMYTSLGYIIYSAKNADGATSFISMYDEGNQDAVQLVYMFPHFCIPNDDGNVREITVNEEVNHNYGYTPKNNKLFTYPYTYAVIDDNYGHVKTLKPELCMLDVGEEIPEYSVTIKGILNPLPSVYVCPSGYAGVVGENNLHGFEITNFPLCTWNVDTFKAWLAQNKNTMALSLISGAVGVASTPIQAMAGYAGGGPVGAAYGALNGLSSLSQIANTMATIADKSVIPDTAKGKMTGDYANFALDLNVINLYMFRPQLSMCKVLDDYWSTFGYPIHEITTPLTNSRSSWNYVKTIDCGFTANAELDLLKRFRNIFNNGVTIWHTDDIGNYGLDNN